MMAVAGLACLATASVRAQDEPGSGPSYATASTDGATIYEEICQACHLAGGTGGGEAGAIVPALAGNPNLRDADFTVSVIVKGRAGMPWFTEMLAPAQIAAVTNHLRGTFNSYPGTVSEADVRRLMAGAPKQGGEAKCDCS